MSRWLKNVGNFLEQLDDRAEQVVEEQRSSGHFGPPDLYEMDNNTVVASILAARGLVQDSGDVDKDETGGADDVDEDNQLLVNTDDEDAADLWNPLGGSDASAGIERQSDNDLSHAEGDGWGDMSHSNTDANAESELAVEGVRSNEDAASEGIPVTTKGSVHSDESTGSFPLVPQQDTEDKIPISEKDADPMHTIPLAPMSGSQVELSSVPDIPLPPTTESPATTRQADVAANLLTGLTSAPPVRSLSTSAAKVAAQAFKSFRNENQSHSMSGGTQQHEPPNPSGSKQQQQHISMEAQKELRTLRRHVVALNQQLEAAEAEMQAQRVELERAAERMQKDNARYKEEREKDKTNHANEIKALRSQHDAALRDQKLRSDAQIEELRSQLRNVEERRMQEGGDWNKELADAIKREQDFMDKLASVEDEKATLLSQISIMLAQQEALGNRLESLSQTAENAFAREREAEDRLDEALGVHARQISQRQSREAELERTIAQLSEALVSERNSKNGLAANQGSDESNATTGLHVDSKIAFLETEVETLRVQLSHEQQRSSTLQAELREVERDRTEDTLIAQKRQQQHDRQVEELTQSLSRVKVELQDARRASLRDARASNGNADDEDVRRIRSLSEEVLRLRERLSNAQSETAALKSRLQAALDRAKKAEAELDEKQENGSNDASDELELGKGYRHRGQVRRRGREHKATIRSALKLDAAQHSAGTEKIGKTLDALDAFLTESGKFLRYNPLARLLFIVYLLLIHLWTFALLIFHAHGFETIHGDFGAGRLLPLGPGAMVQPNSLEAPAVAEKVGG